MTPTTNAAPTGERLYVIALPLIRKKGFEGVTVSEIAREAKVAKGTFFNYLQSKDHLLSEYLRRVLDELIASLADRGQSGTGAILALADALVDRLLADPEVAGALVPRLGALPAARKGEPSEIHTLRAWIRDRLAETLPVQVPLVDPPHPTSLPGLLTWALRGKLEEWARGEVQGGKTLKREIRRELGFLLAGAGLPEE